MIIEKDIPNSERRHKVSIVASSVEEFSFITEILNELPPITYDQVDTATKSLSDTVVCDLKNDFRTNPIVNLPPGVSLIKPFEQKQIWVYFVHNKFLLQIPKEMMKYDITYNFLKPILKNEEAV